MCKWESCLKRSRQEEESFSSQFFGGLFVSVVNRASAPALAPETPSTGCSWRARGSGWLGKEEAVERKSVSHQTFFPIFAHMKLFPCPLITLHCLCLSQMVNYLPSKDYEEQLQGAIKGSAPKSPSSVLLKKGEGILPLESCWYLV